MSHFEVGCYYDQDTKRERWAVFSNDTSTWYFADTYGQKAARKLCDKLNAIYKEEV